MATIRIPRKYTVVKERLPGIMYRKHAALPPNTTSLDLRPKCPPVYDQGQLGSCTANALTGSFQFDDPSWMGSRLFLYYNERSLDRDPSVDAGSSLSTGVKSLTQSGLCAESQWPYDCAKFAAVPPAACYRSALAHKTVASHHVAQDVTSMKEALAAGKPLVVAFQVYESFESDAVAASGMVPLPASSEKCLGGHAVMVVGFLDATQHWIMRNSWGSAWGDKGYFYMPYAYLTDATLASDLWVITQVHSVIPTPIPTPTPPIPIPFPSPIPIPFPDIDPFPIPFPFSVTDIIDEL